MNVFLELKFEHPIFSETYNEIQHFVEKYKLSSLYDLPGDIRLINHVIEDNIVIFLLNNLSTLVELEEFLAKYYQNSFNKFRVVIYLEPPNDFKLKSSEIRWKLRSSYGGAVERELDWSAGLHHLPTNLYVKCDAEGTQKANKVMARRLLTAKVYKTTKLEPEWRDYLLEVFIKG